MKNFALAVPIFPILLATVLAQHFPNDQNAFSWDNLVDLNEIDDDISWDSVHRQKNVNSNRDIWEPQKTPYQIFKFYVLQPILTLLRWRIPHHNTSSIESKLPPHIRVRRAKRRNYIVKCCGKSSCVEGSAANFEKRMQVKKKKQDETEFVDELQYKKVKKKRKKDLAKLRAFGVFTDNGIHISCSGCPRGWPDMLTVYPEYEVGIPVSCSNCPNNWPGALNLLGVGGDPAWNEELPQGDYGDQALGGGGGGRRNKFDSFDPESNFGSGAASGAGVFPPPGFGGGGQDDYQQDDFRTRRPKKRPGNRKTTSSGGYDDGGDTEYGEDSGQTMIFTTKSVAVGIFTATTGADDGEEEDEEEDPAGATTPMSASSAAKKATKAAETSQAEPAADGEEGLGDAPAPTKAVTRPKGAKTTKSAAPAADPLEDGDSGDAAAPTKVVAPTKAGAPAKTTNAASAAGPSKDGEDSGAEDGPAATKVAATLKSGASATTKLSAAKAGAASTAEPEGDGEPTEAAVTKPGAPAQIPKAGAATTKSGAAEAEPVDEDSE